MPGTYQWEDGILLHVKTFPKTAVEYQLLLDKSDYDGIENLLMERFDASPQAIEFFLPAYRAFAKRKETDRAAALLALHVDSLRARGDSTSEVALFSAVLGVWPDCGPARDGLLLHLRTMYADSPNFDRLVKLLNVPQGQGTDALRLLEAWLRYDEGRAVYMAAKGVGRVKEINTTLWVLRVLFESGEQVSLKIDEAQRLAQPLPKGHFLARKLDETAHLKQLAESDPPALLALLFASVKSPLGLAELRGMLSGIVPDAAWTAFWGRARKDHKLVVGAGARPEVRWSGSAADAASDIARHYASASPYEKLDMLQKHAGRSEDLAREMVAGLVKDASAALAKTPSLSLEIALELGDMPAAAGISFGFAPRDLLLRGDCADIISEIKDKNARKKAMALAVEARDDWPQLFARLLQSEQDAQALAWLYDTLVDKGNSSLVEQLVSRTLSDPASSPRLYVWLCQRITDRPELSGRANVEFLLTLLRVVENKAFKGLHAQLRKLFDFGEPADKAASTLGEKESARLLEALGRDTGIEDFRKERLRQEIYQRHPQLHEKKQELVYVTAGALEAKKIEFEKLVRVDIPHNSLEIKRTREFGDLRENFEYHAARHRQEMLSSQAKTLHDELTLTRAIDPATVDASKVSIGTRVFLHSADNPADELALAVLGPWDSDPSKNILSYTSIAGKALLGKRQAEPVPFNDKSYVIERIEVWRG
jgi:transcription elongation factor GreA